MIFTQWNQPFPCQSPSSYIVKNALINNINTLNVHNTHVIIAIDELQDTEFLIAWDVEAGDFNNSGGYCYESFSSLQCAEHAFTYSFLFMIDLKADMPFLYA